MAMTNSIATVPQDYVFTINDSLNGRAVELQARVPNS